MCAFDYPQIELASVEVDVPMYTKTDNKLDNMQQGHVTADVQAGSGKNSWTSTRGRIRNERVSACS